MFEQVSKLQGCDDLSPPPHLNVLLLDAREHDVHRRALVVDDVLQSGDQCHGFGCTALLRHISSDEQPQRAKILSDSLPVTRYEKRRKFFLHLCNIVVECQCFHVHEIKTLNPSLIL